MIQPGHSPTSDLCVLPCCYAGVITWLSAVAESELEAVDAYAQAGEFRPINIVEVIHLALWAALMGTAQKYSNSLPIHPAAWLAPQVLRMAHQVLLRVRKPEDTYSNMLRTALRTAASKLTRRIHPQLCPLVTGRPAASVVSPGACGHTAADVLRQVGHVLCRLSIPHVRQPPACRIQVCPSEHTAQDTLCSCCSNLASIAKKHMLAAAIAMSVSCRMQCAISLQQLVSSPCDVGVGVGYVHLVVS